MRWDTLDKTRAYSQHPHPFGLDAEYVCRLALRHKIKTVQWEDCFILHQNHPHGYNFSHPPFEWQKACEAHEKGEILPEHEMFLLSDWGFPHVSFPESILFPSGRLYKLN